jgi:hypothetical protein
MSRRLLLSGFALKEISGEQDKVDDIHLDFGTEDDVCISGVSEAKYSAKLIGGELPYITYLQFRWLKAWSEDKWMSWATDLEAHLEFDDLDGICEDGGLLSLVEGCVEHLHGICMKLLGEARPFERKAAHGVSAPPSTSSNQTHLIDNCPTAC